MTFYDNKKHFLHNHLTFLESIGQQGKDDGFTNYLKSIGIKVSGKNWNQDHSTIDWSETENQYQFFFDYEENKCEYFLVCPKNLFYENFTIFYYVNSFNFWNDSRVGSKYIFFNPI